MDITAEMISAFRTKWNGTFSDGTKWTNDVVTAALCEGDAETGSERWGAYVDECHNFKQRGMFLFAAHWLSTTYRSQDVTDTVSSETRLNVQTKSVGDESIGYRVPSMLDLGDDWLSTSNYGVQFWRIRRRAGMGAVCV